jgi:hypothetical protein
MDSHFFVFTLGLTESWSNAEGGYEYPMCPGTIAGEFDPARHKFTNQSFPVVRENLAASIRKMREANRKLRFILTVSPVPLTATNSNKHVLVATMYSKSVLRALAGVMAESSNFVDYFPSYEIISSTPFKGVFFEPNQRNVTAFGVNFVMKHFFSSLERKFGKVPRTAAPARPPVAIASPTKKSNDEVCEEELLGAFGAKK